MSLDSAFERSHPPNSIATSDKGCPQMDWIQVVLNGGPPCFYVDPGEPERFCGRAERWQGHGVATFHDFVSLDDLLAAIRRGEREAVFTAIGVDLRRYGANIRKVDLLARFQEMFREMINA